MRLVVLVGGVVVLAASAHADDPEVLTPIPKGKPSFREQMELRLTELGTSVDGHLRALTLDTVQFKLDGRTRRARLRFAGGDSGFLSLKLESNIHFRHGAAAIDTALQVGIAGHAVRLELPKFEVVPRSYLGERYVEIRVPVIHGSF